MAANPLEDIFGARVRGIVYAVFALVGLVIGSVQAAYSAMPDNDVPTVVTVALAVYAYLGIALGFTAASNAKNKPEDTEASADSTADGRARTTA